MAFAPDAPNCVPSGNVPFCTFYRIYHNDTNVSVHGISGVVADDYAPGNVSDIRSTRMASRWYEYVHDVLN